MAEPHPRSFPRFLRAYFDGVPLRNGVIVGEVVPNAVTVADQTLQSISFVDPKEHQPIPFQGKQLRDRVEQLRPD